MELEPLIVRLAANAGVFWHLMEGVTEEQARWKPSPGKWSLLEVVNHLADEEREDFRARIDLTLHHPEEPWPPIDPARWPTERRYQERDPGASLQDFLSERARSVEWLRALGRVDGAIAYPHPRHGPVPVGELLVAWQAHDLIHVRQMTRLHYEYHAERSAPYPLAYAGPW